MKEKIKPKLEKEIQKEVCEWLDYNGYFFWRANNIPVFGMNNGGKRTFRSLPKFTPKGLPDIMIIHRGKFIGIEVKRELGGIVSPDQKAFSLKLAEHGGHYCVVSSVEILKEYLNFIKESI